MQEKNQVDRTFSERLVKLIEYKGYTINSFEKALGYSQSALNKSLKRTGDIGVLGLQKVIEIIPDTNIEWLLTGKGSMLKGNDYPEADTVSEPQSEYGKRVASTFDIANLDKRLRVLEIQVKSLDREDDRIFDKVEEIDEKVNTILKEFTDPNRILHDEP
jgi:hypothetical protein